MGIHLPMRSDLTQVQSLLWEDPTKPCVSQLLSPRAALTEACAPKARVKVTQSRPTLCDPWNSLYSPWNSPGQNAGVGSCSLLQGIFPTQESNQGLLHYRQILYQLYQLSYQGSPRSPTKEATAVRDPRTAMKSRRTHPSGESGTCSNKDPAQPQINKLCKKETRCACIINRRRRWQPTSVLLPGKSHGRRSLVGCSPWGR